MTKNAKSEQRYLIFLLEIPSMSSCETAKYVAEILLDRRQLWIFVDAVTLQEMLRTNIRTGGTCG